MAVAVGHVSEKVPHPHWASATSLCVASWGPAAPKKSGPSRQQGARTAPNTQSTLRKQAVIPPSSKSIRLTRKGRRGGCSNPPLTQNDNAPRSPPGHPAQAMCEMTYGCLSQTWRGALPENWTCIPIGGNTGVAFYSVPNDTRKCIHRPCDLCGSFS